MRSKPKHSPLPWHYKNLELPCLFDANNNALTYSIDGVSGGLENEVDAEFIIKAVNSHYAFVEACKDALREMPHMEGCNCLSKETKAKLKQALKRAKEE